MALLEDGNRSHSNERNRYAWGLLSQSDSSLSIPLKTVKVTSNLSEPVHTVRVQHAYFVPEGSGRVETKFKFPLPSGAAVVDFCANYGTTELYGQLEEKQKAKETYQEAVDEGRTTALLTQVRSDIFECSLGNVPRGQEVTLTITYVESAATDSLPNSIRVSFPSTITPRYQPNNTSEQINPTYSLSPDYQLDFNLSVTT